MAGPGDTEVRGTQPLLAGGSQSWWEGRQAQECKQTKFNSVTAVVAEDGPRSEEYRGGAGMRT